MIDKETREELNLLKVFIRDIREMVVPLEKRIIEIDRRLEKLESSSNKMLPVNKPKAK